MRTAKEWLALGDELGVELVKVLTPGPWEHKSYELGDTIRCSKCFAECDEDSSDCAYHFHPCLVPDPIVLDWNTAKYWQGKIDPPIMFFREIYSVLFSSDIANITFAQVLSWVASLTRPEDAKIPLIAAALAEGAKT